MRLLVCGVRGSTPAPGPEFVRYGGNTSCIAVLSDDDEQPRLVLDAGTGLARLSRSFAGECFVGTILLGHLHWDHTHGLPFFPAGYHPSAKVKLLLPEQGEDAEELLARAFSPPHFPIRPHQLGDGWSFDNLKEGGTLVEQGEKGEELFLLLDGVLAAELDGEKVNELGPGAILGERAILEGGTRTLTLRALTPVKVAVAPGDQIDKKALTEVAVGHRKEENR